MSSRQQALAKVDPEGSGGGEPVVVHRHRRHQHHAEQRPHSDQPEAARASATISASDVIRRLQPELAKVAGITLFMQPVQDLTVEDRVSRTQFQYTLEDPNADELNTYAPRMLAKLQKLPELRDVASDQQTQGLQARLVFDRDTASRLGITPSTHRPDAVRRLRPAAGLDHVHAVESVSRGAGVDAGFPARIRWTCAISIHPLRHGARRQRGGLVSGGSAVDRFTGRAGSSATAPSTRGSRIVARRSLGSSSAVFGGADRHRQRCFPMASQVPLSAFTHVETSSVPITVNHQGQFPVVTLSFNLAPGASLGDAVKR